MKELKNNLGLKIYLLDEYDSKERNYEGEKTLSNISESEARKIIAELNLNGDEWQEAPIEGLYSYVNAILVANGEPELRQGERPRAVVLAPKYKVDLMKAVGASICDSLTDPANLLIEK